MGSTDQPDNTQHAFRISLNQTRRVVRRVIELGLDQEVPTSLRLPDYQALMASRHTDFLLSLRMLRRVVHRLIEQAGPVALTPARPA
jgi:hypothetical protein